MYFLQKMRSLEWIYFYQLRNFISMTEILRKETLTKEPVIDKSAFIAQNAIVLSGVQLAKDSSVWYNSVLRGDINDIYIGEGSNIQDGSILHVTDDLPCVVGERVVVGHHVNLHACHIGDQCLIGIGSIILSGAKIAPQTVIAAGAVVTENSQLEPGYVYAGIPAKPVKKINHEHLNEIEYLAEKYIRLKNLYLEKGIK